MSSNIFEPIDPIRFGWNTLKANLRFFAVLMVIVAVIYNLPSLISMILASGEGSLDNPLIIAFYILVAIASVIFYSVIDLGLIDIALGFRDGRSPQIGDLFQQYPLLLKYFVAYLIYSLMVLIGLILLIVPGIYLALRYQFYGYLIVDRRIGPIEALKESSRLTNGALMNLFVFWLVLYCSILVIMLLFMVFIAMPLGFMGAAISPDLAVVFTTIYSFIVSIISTLIILPIIKLSTADIYRILEARLAASSAMPAPASPSATDEGI